MKEAIDMIDDAYRIKAKSIIAKAKEKGKIKTYAEFIKNEKAYENKLSEESTNYTALTGENNRK